MAALEEMEKLNKENKIEVSADMVATDYEFVEMKNNCESARIESTADAPLKQGNKSIFPFISHKFTFGLLAANGNNDENWDEYIEAALLVMVHEGIDSELDYANFEQLTVQPTDENAQQWSTVSSENLDANFSSHGILRYVHCNAVIEFNF